LIGRYDEGIAERKKAVFKARYLATLRPFPGVADLLDGLRSRGVKLAVASSAAHDELEALLEVAKATRYFEARTDADDAERSKPDPGIVQAALARLALPAARCLMIGDTPYDAEAARRAGIAFVGVRCGGWGDTDLQPAIGVYGNPADVARNLERVLSVRGSARRTPS
jgi:HAD superfamily hydrolase (TIGR01509 family)